MRIIGGSLGGRRVNPPANMPHTRPTTDIAKEGLFNISTETKNESRSKWAMMRWDSFFTLLINFILKQFIKYIHSTMYSAVYNLLPFSKQYPICCVINCILISSCNSYDVISNSNLQTKQNKKIHFQSDIKFFTDHVNTKVTFQFPVSLYRVFACCHNP